MDALMLLQSDHERIRKLFADLEREHNKAGSDGVAVLAALRSELQEHSRIEEGIFYPIVEQSIDQLIGTVSDSLDEHRQIENLLKEIFSCSDKQSAQAAALITDLRQAVERHVDEEETHMFPRVRETISADELERMGEEITIDQQAAARKGAATEPRS
jgi:hemerythrin-like domain-containing protein